MAVDTLHHDVATAPGRARLALTVQLFNRRQRSRAASRHFSVDLPTARADSAAAAAALSQAVRQAFDALVPWLEVELARAAQPSG